MYFKRKYKCTLPPGRIWTLSHLIDQCTKQRSVASFMWLCCSIIKLEQTVSVYQPSREVTSFKCVPSRVPISTLEQQRARSSLGIGEAAPACSGESLASHFGSKFCHGKKKIFRFWVWGTKFGFVTSRVQRKAGTNNFWWSEFMGLANRPEFWSSHSGK